MVNFEHARRVFTEQMKWWTLSMQEEFYGTNEMVNFEHARVGLSRFWSRQTRWSWQSSGSTGLVQPTGEQRESSRFHRREYMFQRVCWGYPLGFRLCCLTLHRVISRKVLTVCGWAPISAPLPIDYAVSSEIWNRSGNNKYIDFSEVNLGLYWSPSPLHNWVKWNCSYSQMPMAQGFIQRGQKATTHYWGLGVCIR